MLRALQALTHMIHMVLNSILQVRNQAQRLRIHPSHAAGESAAGHGLQNLGLLCTNNESAQSPGKEAPPGPRTQTRPPNSSKHTGGTEGFITSERTPTMCSLFFSITVNIFITSTNVRMFGLYHLFFPSVITISQNRAPTK